MRARQQDRRRKGPRRSAAARRESGLRRTEPRGVQGRAPRPGQDRHARRPSAARERERRVGRGVPRGRGPRRPVSRRVAKFLVALGAWTLYVWGTRLWIMAHQHNSAGFVVVHVTLALISIGFGLVAGVIGWRVLRTREAVPEPPVDASV